MHFWDPMMNRLTSARIKALDSAAMARAGGMFMIIGMTTTTRMRGASG